MGMDAECPETADKPTFVILSFRIMGDEFDPQLITELLGLEPDKAFNKGDKRNEDRPELHRFSFWGLDTKVDRDLSLEKHLEAMLDRLATRTESICELSKEFTVDFYCSIFSEHMVGVVLSKEVIQRVYELGAEIDIVFYPF